MQKKLLDVWAPRDRLFGGGGRRATYTVTNSISCHQLLVSLNWFEKNASIIFYYRLFFTLSSFFCVLWHERCFFAMPFWAACACSTSKLIWSR